MAKKSEVTPAIATAVPTVIHELVAKFAEHREEYKRGDYNETQLRQDFLDPFFAALGWDMDNKQRYADARYETPRLIGVE